MTLDLDAYQSRTHPLDPSSLSGLKFLLASIAHDSSIIDIRWVCYMLATVRHECAGKWQPIEEFGKGVGHPYGIPVNGHIYYGRGFVQITWEKNYRAMGDVLGVDLVNNPDLALDPDIAYKIMSYGMTHGSFTGVSLSHYINSFGTDYFNARRIINALDQAQKIADYAKLFEELIK